MEALVLSAVLAVGLGLLVAIELRERPADAVQTVELRFGADLTESVATALIGAIAGLPSRAAVALDVVSDHEGIRHFLRSDQTTLDALSGSWRGMLPSLRLEPVETMLPQEWSCGAVMRPSETAVLRRDAVVESAAALLGALGPLGTSEVVVVRSMLRPGSRPRSVEPVRQRRQRHGESLLAALVQESGVAADHARALRLKYAGPIVEGALVVAAHAGHPKRAVHLVSRVVSVVRARRGSYGSLAARRAADLVWPGCCGDVGCAVAGSLRSSWSGSSACRSGRRRFPVWCWGRRRCCCPHHVFLQRDGCWPSRPGRGGCVRWLSRLSGV